MPERQHKYCGGCAQILGFENIPKLYKEDQDFAPTFAKYQHRGFYVHEG